MKTILLTGASGQDGQLFVEAYHHSYKIILLHQKGRKQKPSVGVTEDTNSKWVDLTNSTELCEAINSTEPDFIISLASISTVWSSWDITEQTLNFNMRSAAALLEAICKSDFRPKVFMAGSAEIFCKKSSVLTESSLIQPETPYALSKAFIKHLSDMYRQIHKLKIVYGILFNHESRLRPTNFFIPKVIVSSAKIAAGEQDYLNLGNLSIIRDIGYAPEYITSIEKLLISDADGPYVVSTGTGCKLQDLVISVFDYFDLPHEKLKLEPTLLRAHEATVRIGDHSKLLSEIEFTPSLSGNKLIRVLITDYGYEVINEK